MYSSIGFEKKHIHKLNFMIQPSYTKQRNLYTKACVNKLLFKTVFSTKIWKLDIEIVYVYKAYLAVKPNNINVWNIGLQE